jgi:hypothetical protein
MAERHDAPDFTPGYPSGGDRIGPAWSAMWADLADGRWHDRTKLAPGAPIGAKTRKALSTRAVAAGLLDVRYTNSLGHECGPYHVDAGGIVEVRRKDVETHDQ